MANTNPDLLDGFAEDINSLKEEIPVTLSSLGWSLTNSKINGKQLNTIFNQIFGYLNFLQTKGLSFWQEDKPYVATTSYIDIVRRGNKIYFAKQDSNPDPVNNPAPKAPESNPDYWGVLLDLDNPIENYAFKNGSATNLFKVKDGVADDEAVSKLQMETAISNIGVDIADFINVKSQNGYQKLPNGLILQWFTYYPVPVGNTYTALRLPIAFPKSCLIAVGTASNGTSVAAYTVDIGARTTTTISVKTDHYYDAGVQIIAIGY